MSPFPTNAGGEMEERCIFKNPNVSSPSQVLLLLLKLLVLTHFTQFVFFLVSMKKKITGDFRGSLEVLANMPFLIHNNAHE